MSWIKSQKSTILSKNIGPISIPSPIIQHGSYWNTDLLLVTKAPFQATIFTFDSQNVYIRGRAWPHKTSHLRPTHSSYVGFSASYPLFFRRFWHFTTPKVIVLDTNFAILTQKTRLWQRKSWDFRRKIRNLMTSQSLLRGFISTPETTFYHGQTLTPRNLK
jgi:hypothetical protein